MHEHFFRRARLYGRGIEITNPAGKFGAVQIADADDVAGGEIPFATRDAGRQEAFAVFAQSFFCAVIDK